MTDRTSEPTVPLPEGSTPSAPDVDTTDEGAHDAADSAGRTPSAPDQAEGEGEA